MTGLKFNGVKIKPFTFMEVEEDGNETLPMGEISEMVAGLESAEEGVNSEGHSEAFSAP